MICTDSFPKSCVAIALASASLWSAPYAAQAEEFRVFYCAQTAEQPGTAFTIYTSGSYSVVFPSGVPVLIDGEGVVWSTNGVAYALNSQRLVSITQDTTTQIPCADISSTMIGLSQDALTSSPAIMTKYANAILSQQIAKLKDDLAQRDKEMSDLVTSKNRQKVDAEAATARAVEAQKALDEKAIAALNQRIEKLQKSLADISSTSDAHLALLSAGISDEECRALVSTWVKGRTAEVKAKFGDKAFSIVQSCEKR